MVLQPLLHLLKLLLLLFQLLAGAQPRCVELDAPREAQADDAVISGRALLRVRVHA